MPSSQYHIRIAVAARRNGAGRGSGQAIGLRDALFVRGVCDCLLRAGEAALDVADVSFEGDGLAVVVRRSKTDRHGRGSAHYAGPPATRLLRPWLAAAGIDHVASSAAQANYCRTT